MKRLLILTATATAVAALAPLAGAGSSDSMVVGAGERATAAGAIVNHFAVDAHTGPAGVSGRYHAESATPGSGSFDVDVKCIYQLGNRAVIGGLITHEVNRPGLDGVGFAIAFEDNGDPSAGTTPDRVSFNDFYLEPGRTPPVTEADCAAEAPVLFDTFQPMAAGNVRVT